MLYPIYAAVKQQLSNPSNNIDNTPRAGIALPVEWFNMQYEGVMAKEKGFFVEFPEALKFDPKSKQMRRTPLQIRLHYFSKAVQTHDGIADAIVEEHEVIALQAKNLLDGFTPAGGVCSRLTFKGWRHWHRWKGWMVTYVEFGAKEVVGS